MKLVEKYFPGLAAEQKKRFDLLPAIYGEWNAKINVISRKDIEHLEERHILHSLAIARFISFKPGTRVLDVGTGGGFPGIPLAIFFPEVKFHLADSVGKKIKVVEEAVKSTGLKNVTAEKARAEDLKMNFDFIVSRAVAPMKEIYDWTRHLIAPQDQHAIANGWILLKGGDLSKEIMALKRKCSVVEVSTYFSESFFDKKAVVYFSSR
ncbi:MAG: 16S rRNA (guanine(527)-N(7))-methyltransferase RsmG [Chitinophagales bacterium]|nr:16S rRNA (guanine(527)-N(7))-methyltransferase RsmG [Chitinophagales bacterium]